jgi:cysteinyl-tRNA synthetase
MKDNNDTSAKLLAAPHAALEALNNDLNTPAALRVIEEAFTELENSNLRTVQKAALIGLLDFIDNVLGLQLQQNTPDITDEYKQRILERERARENKDWALSDSIREELKNVGIGLSDAAHGVRWYYLK